MKPRTILFCLFVWTTTIVLGLSCASSTSPLPEPQPSVFDAGPNLQGSVSYFAANPAPCAIGTPCLQTADPATGAPWVAVANTISGSSGSGSSGGSSDGSVTVDGGVLTANQGAPNDGGTSAWPVIASQGPSGNDPWLVVDGLLDQSVRTPGVNAGTALAVQGVTGGIVLSTGDTVLDALAVDAGAASSRALAIQGIDGGVAIPVTGSVSISGPISVTQGTSPWVTTDTTLDANTVDAGAAAGKALAIQGIDGGVAVSVRITGPFGQAPAATSISIIDAVGVSNIGAAVAVPAAGVQISTGRNVVRFVQIYNGSGAVVIPFLIDGTAQPTAGAAPTWQTTSNSATTTTLAVSKLVFATGVRLVFSTTSGIYAAVPGATAGITYSIETDN